MVLAKRKVSLTVALLSAALAGLVGVQAYLLHTAVQLKERNFRSNVYTALHAVPRKLEATEVVEKVYRLMGPPPKAGEADSAAAQRPATRGTWLQKRAGAPGPTHEVTVGLSSLQARECFGVDLALPDSGHHPDRVLRLLREVAGEGGPPRIRELMPEGDTLLTVVASARRDLVERVVLDMSTLDRRAITERLSLARLDSVLTRSLREVGIGLPFRFGILRADCDSLVAVSDSGHAEELARSDFRASLFPLEFLPPFHELVVHFPGARAYAWLQIWPLLAASLLFTLVIVAGFVQSVRTILAQQRFAQQIIGFINNMTHEFRTPISTVALAGEAMGRPEVLGQPDTLRRYSRIIQDENQRMREQVETILQVTQLERGDFELNREATDLHGLIQDVVAAFALQVEKRRGTITCELAGGEAPVEVDRLHLSNAVRNLVDNAVKYSDGPPQIIVRTHRRDGEWVVEIADRGVGIAAADRPHVFDRYYRCATGDRHDIKGFGLGLSYVKLIIEAHGGRVSLDSATGRGTTVTVRLPAMPREGSG